MTVYPEVTEQAANAIEQLRGLLSEAIGYVSTSDEHSNPFNRETEFIERAKAAIR